MSDELQTRLIWRLKASQTPGEHPDAETLTALRERKLKARGRDTVMDHLSRCAACRDSLLLCAEDVPNRRQLFVAALAAAAVIVFFAGAATSKKDAGLIYPNSSKFAKHVRLVPGDLAPKISYAVATLEQPAARSQWRIRNSALESSVDKGKTWQRAKLDRSFNAQEVRYDGSDVWVRSQSGELMLSRDGGLHWTFLNPVKGR